jgi:hypothetical protein
MRMGPPSSLSSTKKTVERTLSSPARMALAVGLQPRPVYFPASPGWTFSILG